MTVVKLTKAKAANDTGVGGRRADAVFDDVKGGRLSGVKNVLLLTSGKGGVGKTTVAVNLASALAQRDLAVGILDADVYGPSVPRMLGLQDEQMRWSDDDKIIAAENFGLKVMSVGMTTPDKDTPLAWRSSVAVSALIQLCDDVDWGDLDVLIIDMPPGTGDVQLTMMQELNVAGAVVVTTPQQVACDDVRRSLRMLQEMKVPVAGVVENMSGFVAPDTGETYFPFGKGGGEGLAKDYDVRFLGELPLDPAIGENADRGMPIAAIGDDAQKAHFGHIADTLLAENVIRLDDEAQGVLS